MTKKADRVFKELGELYEFNRQIERFRERRPAEGTAVGGGGCEPKAPPSGALQREAPKWQYDEFKSVGRDYGQVEEAAIYDASHADFRDLEAEAVAMWQALGVGADATVLEYGCGTGVFAVAAAQRAARVVAVDVSEAMLAVTRERAAAAGVDNLTLVHGGFLTYEHVGDPVEAIVTSLAFHHLPDFWKGVALVRLHRWLKPGGTLLLNDVVLPDTGGEEAIAAFVAKQEAAGGDFLREDAEGHFRDEFSTYDWVMRGLLARVGFTVRSAEWTDGVICRYLAVRA